LELELGADVDPFMLHVYAALAEKERALISERTKAALQVAKIRLAKEGKRLGSPSRRRLPPWRAPSGRPGPPGRTRTTCAVITDIQRAGVATLTGIAKALEARGIRTPSGRSTWQAVQVSRLMGEKAALIFL